MLQQNGSGQLELRDIRITLGERVLVSLSATIAAGEILTVMGPSGSGKSTLLAWIGGFLPDAFLASGSIRIDGSELTALAPEKRRAGLLFQDALLFPHLSVLDNVGFAVPAIHSDRQERREIAADMLEKVGLAAMGARDPETLSGGQKARVALARVLVSRPRLLLLDEPFSKLDTALRNQMRELVFDHARSMGIPAILVTHDEADAVAAAGEIRRL